MSKQRPASPPLARGSQRYPGAKSGAGVYQAIINEMPPHDVYIEAFVGSGAILRRKKSALSSIVIDADRDVAARWSTIAKSGAVAGALTAIHGDARSILADFDYGCRRVLVYCDPPYVRSARRSRIPIYRHEMTDADHRSLLSLLLTLPAAVMISGYRNPMYDAMLARWRRIDFKAMTHAGPATESLWLNFECSARHEYTYLGENFRERERIKRKKARWRRRLENMPLLERQAVLDVLLDLASSEVAGRSASSEMALPDLTPDAAMRPGAVRIATIDGAAGVARVVSDREL